MSDQPKDTCLALELHLRLLPLCEAHCSFLRGMAEGGESGIWWRWTGSGQRSVTLLRPCNGLLDQVSVPGLLPEGELSQIESKRAVSCGGKRMAWERHRGSAICNHAGDWGGVGR